MRRPAIGLAAGVVLAGLGSPGVARAYPELTRHGYVNCSSCHVSPSGGGVLTQYGRELSESVLSTWSRPGEEQPLWGVVHPPEPLQLGGDYRSIYVYRDTPLFRDGRFIQMQADAEAALSLGPLTVDGMLGYESGLSSRRHYLLYHLNDELGVRAGKFLFDYGINSPNHVRVTRRALNLNDEGSETYNLELSYLSENWSAYATAVLGRLSSDRRSSAETAMALSGDRHFGDRYKAGLSYYVGRSEQAGTRQLFGPYGILGFTKRLYLLTELDLQVREAGPGATSWGFAQDQRLGYELTQGLNLYFAQEFARLEFSDPSSIAESVGPGLQFYPRPHLELDFTWQKQRIARSGDAWIDYAYLMLHFYL